MADQPLPATQPRPAGIPYPFKIEHCDTCGRRVIWAITKNGKDMPVEPDLDPRGTASLTPQPGRTPLVMIIVNEALRAGREFRMVHYANCATPRKPRDYDQSRSRTAVRYR